MGGLHTPKGLSQVLKKLIVALTLAKKIKEKKKNSQMSLNLLNSFLLKKIVFILPSATLGMLNLLIYLRNLLFVAARQI